MEKARHEDHDMNTSTVSYDTSSATFRSARLTAFAVIFALAGCAGADASPSSGPLPEMAAAAAEAPRPRLEAAPVTTFAEQWRSPFAAQVFGEIEGRTSRSAAVRVRPAAQRVREIAWGPLADREQKGKMARAQVTVSIPAAAATTVAVATRTARQAAAGIE